MNRHEQRQKEKLGYTFTAGDIDWTPKTITRISLLSILSGFCATGCGLGSPPLIYNQFLDPYKTPPPVIQNSAAYASIYASGSVMIISMINETMNY